MSVLVSIVGPYLMGLFMCALVGLAAAHTFTASPHDRRIGSRMFFLAPVWPLALLWLVLRYGKDMLKDIAALIKSMWKSAWGK